MGFLDHGSMTRQHSVTVLTAGFQINCTLHAIGTIQTFLNDEQKDSLTLFDATMYGLRSDNPAASVAVPELHIRKPMIAAILFDAMLPQEEVGLLSRKVPVAAYTADFVVQGNYHLGPEDRVGDFIDVAKSAFTGATDVSVFPLFEARAAVIQQAPLAFLHRSQIRLHHQI